MTKYKEIPTQYIVEKDCQGKAARGCERL